MGTVDREIVCIRQTTQAAEVVDDTSCAQNGQKPAEKAKCTGPCGQWRYGRWSGVSSHGKIFSVFNKVKFQLEIQLKLQLKI